MIPRRPRSRTPQEVLDRGPWLVEAPPRNALPIDPIEQIEELVELLDRGLLSRSEFERQKRKVLDIG